MGTEIEFVKASARLTPIDTVNFNRPPYDQSGGKGGG